MPLLHALGEKWKGERNNAPIVASACNLVNYNTILTVESRIVCHHLIEHSLGLLRGTRNNIFATNSGCLISQRAYPLESSCLKWRTCRCHQPVDVLSMHKTKGFSHCILFRFWPFTVAFAPVGVGVNITRGSCNTQHWP